MGNIVDLIKMGDVDPEYLKNVLSDDEKLSKHQLSSAELELLKKLDIDKVRTIVEIIEEKIGVNPKTASQACSGGTQACAG